MRIMAQPSEARLRNELPVICFIALLLVPSVALSPSSVPRVLLGLPVIFFFPGYALLSALYPRREDLSGVERLLLSFAMSLAVVPLIGLALNFTWGGVTLYPVVLSLTLFIVAMSAVGWWRRQSLPDDERFTLSVHFWVAQANLRGRWGYWVFLWLLLIALTALILLLPVKLTLEPSPIESVNIFASLPLVAGLFLAWMGILLLLVLPKKESRANVWEGLALACVSALGLISFWVIITPYGQIGDPLARFGDTMLLMEAGRVPEQGGIYFGFPGLFLFTSFVSLITRLDLFAISNLMRLFSTILFVSLLYLTYTHLFRGASLAPLVVLMAILAGTAPRISFLGDLITGPLLLAFLVLLTRSEQRMFDTVQDRILAIILLAAATITYFMDSWTFIFIVLGIYVAQRWAREKPAESSILPLALVVLLSWQIYWATDTFSSLSQYLPALREQLLGGETFQTARTSSQSAVGAAVPLWAIATRYLWWILFYGLGSILGLLWLVRAARLTPATRKEVGGLLGVVLLVGLATVAGERGFQFNRYFIYAPIFLAPILTRLFLGLGQGWKSRTFVVLPAMMFVLAFPTFLLDGSTIATDSVHSQDVAAGQFLQSNYGKGDGLHVFSNTASIFWYYTPNATDSRPRQFHLLGGEGGLWEDMDRLLDEFKSPTGNIKVFLFSERMALNYYHLFGIQPTDPGWQHIKEELARENLIFDNDYVHMYIPSSKREP